MKFHIIAQRGRLVWAAAEQTKGPYYVMQKSTLTITGVRTFGRKGSNNSEDFDRSRAAFSLLCLEDGIETARGPALDWLILQATMAVRGIRTDSPDFQSKIAKRYESRLVAVRALPTPPWMVSIG